MVDDPYGRLGIRRPPLLDAYRLPAGGRMSELELFRAHSQARRRSSDAAATVAPAPAPAALPHWSAPLAPVATLPSRHVLYVPGLLGPDPWLDWLRGRGLVVHRIGRAAYAHHPTDPTLRILAGFIVDGEPAPPHWWHGRRRDTVIARY